MALFLQNRSDNSIAFNAYCMDNVFKTDLIKTQNQSCLTALTLCEVVYLNDIVVSLHRTLKIFKA